ncbi:MAG TPA: hypothetical protein VFQ30_13850 [Ktedonobacteraceae bacterium]|nr:hypothetical protein [Ktedonobacteraceae bacterium]
MKEISILELVWDDVNEQHIWERHQLTRSEVEEVAYGPAENLVVRRTYGERYLVIGPNTERKLFVLILAPKGTGKFYPVSARPASQKERRDYREWKAGKRYE